jgi:hypothetical protein
MKKGGRILEILILSIPFSSMYLESLNLKG